jgi:hypothetical protein
MWQRIGRSTFEKKVTLHAEAVGAMIVVKFNGHGIADAPPRRQTRRTRRRSLWPHGVVSGSNAHSEKRAGFRVGWSDDCRLISKKWEFF